MEIVGGMPFLACGLCPYDWKTPALPVSQMMVHYCVRNAVDGVLRCNGVILAWWVPAYMACSTAWTGGIAPLLQASYGLFRYSSI
jgi:hypothetical protein